MEQKTYEVSNESLTRKEEPMTDKAFSRLFLTSLIALLVTLAALCSTTYAWYTATITTSGVLSAAYYDIAVSVTADETELNANSDGSYLLNAGEGYTVTIKKSTYANADNGYCQIILDGESYFTEQINSAEIIFTLVSAEDAIVFFVPHIGTSTASEKIANGDIFSPGA